MQDMRDRTKIESRDNEGRTALILAAMRGNIMAVNALLEFYPRLEVTDKEEWTALMYAVDGNHVKVISALLSHKANTETETVHPGTNVTALLAYAVHRCQEETIQVLLAHKANVDACSPTGDTPLTMAIRTGRLNILNTLVAHDPSAYMQRTRTAFLYAQRHHCTEMEQLLIQCHPHLAKMD